MYIVIVGAGKVGYYLAQLLVDESHDAVVIDQDQAVCELISQELDIVASQGDGTEISVLEKAGVKEADAVVTLTGKDETNMVVSLLAKELGAKLVATRIEKVQYDVRVLKKLGIDIVIHPEAAAAAYIEQLITRPDVLDLAFLSKGKAEIMEILVKEKSKLAGKKVSEVELPENSSIVAMHEGEDFIVPKQDTNISVGAKLLVLAKQEVSEKVRKMLM